MLEPCAAKVACTVPRGLGAGDSPRLPDEGDPLDLSLEFGQHAILFEKSISAARNISQNGGRGGLDRVIGKMYFLFWLKEKFRIRNELLILRPARLAELFNTVACNLSSHLKQAKVFPVETRTS